MCLMHILTAHMQRKGRGGGGFAGYGVWFGALHPLNISSPLPGPVQTNNRAELTACLYMYRCLCDPVHAPLGATGRRVTN